MNEAGLRIRSGGAYVVAAAAFGAALSISPAAHAADGGIIIDRGRLDVVTPPKPAPAPAVTDNRNESLGPAAAPNAKITSLQIVGEDDTKTLRELEREAAPLRGAPITTENLQRLLDVMHTHYEKAGLALSRIVAPQQTFENGRVQVVVLKGYVSEVVVEGVKGRDAAYLRKRAAKLVSRAPLKSADLQRILLLLSATPGFKLDARFEQAGNDPNAVRLKIVAHKRSVEAGASVDNQGERLLGKTQFELTAAFNGAVIPGDRLQLYYGFPAEFDLYRYVALSYSTPLGASGLQATLSGSSLHTQPKGPSVEGDAYTMGLQFSYPLIRTKANSLLISGGLDALTSDNAFLGQVFSQEHTRVVRAAASYVHVGKASVVSASTTLSEGLDGLGARVDEVYGGPQFTKLNVRVSYDRAFAKHYAVTAKAFAQVGDSRLPPSERLQFGGEEMGRGFQAGYAAAPQGVDYSLDLTRRIKVGPVSEHLLAAEIFTFADGAQLSDDKVFATSARSLASIGVGAGLRLFDKFTARVHVAKPVAGADDGAEVGFALKAAL